MSTGALGAVPNTEPATPAMAELDLKCVNTVRRPRHRPSVPQRRRTTQRRLNAGRQDIPTGGFLLSPAAAAS